MDQCPEVGSPTSEAQPYCLAGAPRAFHPHRLEAFLWRPQNEQSPHPTARILKVYTEALTGFSHVFSPDGLNTTLLSQSCILENSSLCVSL